MRALHDEFAVHEYEHIEYPAHRHSLFAACETTEGANGTVTRYVDRAEIREPGDATAKSDTRLYEPTVALDPATPGRVRFKLENVNIDATSAAQMYFFFAADPDRDGNANGDEMGAVVKGDGSIQAQTNNNGSTNNNQDASQGNGFIDVLKFIELDYDGSQLSVTASDGSFSVSTTSATDYPTGEPLYLKIAAHDNNASGATNIDFDVAEIHEVIE